MTKRKHLKRKTAKRKNTNPTKAQQREAEIKKMERDLNFLRNRVKTAIEKINNRYDLPPHDRDWILKDVLDREGNLVLDKAWIREEFESVYGESLKKNDKKSINYVASRIIGRSLIQKSIIDNAQSQNKLAEVKDELEQLQRIVDQNSFSSEQDEYTKARFIHLFFTCFYQEDFPSFMKDLVEQVKIRDVPNRGESCGDTDCKISRGRRRKRALLIEKINTIEKTEDDSEEENANDSDESENFNAILISSNLSHTLIHLLIEAVQNMQKKRTLSSFRTLSKGNNNSKKQPWRRFLLQADAANFFVNVYIEFVYATTLLKYPSVLEENINLDINNLDTLTKCHFSCLNESNFNTVIWMKLSEDANCYYYIKNLFINYLLELFPKAERRILTELKTCLAITQLYDDNNQNLLIITPYAWVALMRQIKNNFVTALLTVWKSDWATEKKLKLANDLVAVFNRLEMKRANFLDQIFRKLRYNVLPIFC